MKFQSAAKLLALSVGLCLAGCIFHPKPQPVGDHPPVIEASFASPSIQMGDIWRIYVRAHDEDGDMWEARFHVEQAGVLYDPFMGDVFLPKRLWKTIDGYFYLHGASAAQLSGGKVDMTLSLELIDRGGRKSEKVEFPLNIGRKKQARPPEGFREKPLIAVPIRIRRSGDEGSSTWTPLPEF